MIPPIGLMVVSVLAASTAAIFVRFAQREASSLVVAAYRLGIGTLVITPFALIRHWTALRMFSRRDWMLAALSGIFLAFHFASWITSLEFITVASSAVLVSMSPLIVALLSTLLLQERLARATWFGLGVAIAGSILIAIGQSGNNGLTGINWLAGSRLWGSILALAGASFVAVYLIIGRSLRARIQLVPYAFVVFGIAAITLLLTALISGQQLTGFSGQTYLWFMLLGLIPQIIGHIGFNWALRYLPASFVSIALLGEPIGSGLLALAILGETPTWVELFGGILILSGIYLAARRRTARRLP